MDNIPDREWDVLDTKDIGKAVRAAREKSGLRQAQAAALCGVGTRFMSDLENGKPTLQTAKVLKVLQALGMQIILQPKKFGHG
jgi:HTH-type transcriptional regulator / antitoxin HipB